MILQLREQCFHLLSLPLCFGELWRVDQLPRTLSGRFVLVNDEAPEGSAGALWSERAWATLLACPDVVEGSIAINSPAVIEELASRADVAIVFRFVSKTLGTEEWTPLSVNAIAGPHVGSDGGWPRLSPHAKAGALPLSHSLREGGALDDIGWRPDLKKKIRPEGALILASNIRPFYRDSQRLGLRLPWKQAIATIRCS